MMIYAWLAACARTWRVEWRHTYLSARREHTRRHAARLWARELAAAARDLPAYAREIHHHRKAPR